MVQPLTNEQLQARADSEQNAHVQAAFIELIQRRKLEESMTQGSGIDDIARLIKSAIDEVRTEIQPGLMDNPLHLVMEADDEDGAGRVTMLNFNLTPADLEAAVFALATVRGQLTHVSEQIAELQEAGDREDADAKSN